MPKIQIVPCRLAHLRSVAARLRPEERAELAALGELARHSLHALWRDTLNPWAALLDGCAVACWGDSAGTLASEGCLWVATTPEIDHIRFAFARIARQEIDGMLFSRASVRTSVHKSCERALRFARLLGFRETGADVGEGFIDMRVMR